MVAFLLRQSCLLLLVTMMILLSSYHHHHHQFCIEAFVVPSQPSIICRQQRHHNGRNVALFASTTDSPNNNNNDDDNSFINDDVDDSLSKKEQEYLKREVELLRRENELYKREAELYKKEVALLTPSTPTALAANNNNKKNEQQPQIMSSNSISDTQEVEVDLDRETLKLESFDTYILAAALVSTTSLDSLVFFQPIDDPTMELGFPENILCLSAQLTGVIGTISGLFATVVFTLVELYGKSALGRGRDKEYEEFLDSTKDIRVLGFQAFSACLLSFPIHAALVAVERVRGIESKTITGVLSAIGCIYLILNWNTIINAAARIYEEDERANYTDFLLSENTTELSTTKSDENGNNDKKNIIVDLDREGLKLGSFDTRILASALVATTSLNSLVFFQPIDDPMMELGFPQNILCLLTQLTGVLGTIAGLFSTVVFTLVELYGKYALGRKRDAVYLEFLQATDDIRTKGYQAFSACLLIFPVHAGLVAVERVRGVENKTITGILAALGTIYVTSNWNAIVSTASRIYDDDDK